MILRDFNIFKDILPIDRIFKKQPELGVPSLRHVIDNCVIEKDEELIAYGVIKFFAEAIMIIDRENTRKREKAEALTKIIERGISSSKNMGIEKLFLISNDENFSKVLMRKYGFRRCSGETLALELENGR